jgi:hypothetical protein
MAATTTSKLKAINQIPSQKHIPAFTQCNLGSIWPSLRCFGIQPDFGGGARDGKTTDFPVIRRGSSSIGRDLVGPLLALT